MLGLFEKVVLADAGLANVADRRLRGDRAPVGFVDAWLGTLAFSGQIFCDFAGYSTIAIGVALCLGFALPDNFRMPYAAIGFSDFWRRWHISLSTWLRDYLYIPLGGNRGDGAAHLRQPDADDAARRPVARRELDLRGLGRTARALPGGRALDPREDRRRGRARGPWNRLALALLTYVLVNLTWVFFRAHDFGGAARMLAGMFGLAGDAPAVLPTIYMIKAAVIVVGIVTVQWLMRKRELEDVVARTPWWVTGLVAAAMLFAVIIAQGSGEAFIYFQF